MSENDGHRHLYEVPEGDPVWIIRCPKFEEWLFHSFGEYNSTPWFCKERSSALAFSDQTTANQVATHLRLHGWRVIVEDSTEARG